MHLALAWLLTTGAVALAQAVDDEGYPLTSKRFGVSIVFPEKPKSVEQKDGEQHLLELPGVGAMMLQVTRLDKVFDAQDRVQSKKVLDAAQESVAKALAGRLVLSKDDPAEKRPTRDFEIDLGEAGYYVGRLVADDGRLYHVAVMGKKEFTRGKEAVAFRSSLEIAGE